MRYRMLCFTVLAALVVSACGAPSTSLTGVAVQPAIAATTSPVLPTPTVAPAPALRVVGIGVVMATREVDLNFTVSGSIAEVLVRPGDLVSATQELARLDGRRFEQQVRQLAAAVQIARAQEAALTSPPNAASVAAAKAQVQQAKIVLAQTRVEQIQDNRTADASLIAAQAGLQDTRDRLSANKTNAELALQSAVSALTQAQTDYSVAKRNWQIASERSQDPIIPKLAGADGQPVENRLSEGQRQQYYAAFVQAETALRGAETAVAQARVAFDNARQAEVTGIQQAEQQTAQAQAGRMRQQLPAEIDRAAVAQAAAEAAQANLNQLFPMPSEADRKQARASIEQAEAILAAAQIDLESVVLRAPFAGIVAEVAINPGDFSGASAGAAIRIADVSRLRVDMHVSDLDIARVREGQYASIFIDGMPGGSYSGRVRAIAPTAITHEGRRTFLVEIALDTWRDLRPGMSARVEIAIKQQTTH